MERWDLPKLCQVTLQRATNDCLYVPDCTKTLKTISSNVNAIFCGVRVDTHRIKTRKENDLSLWSIIIIGQQGHLLRRPLYTTEYLCCLSSPFWFCSEKTPGYSYLIKSYLNKIIFSFQDSGKFLFRDIIRCNCLLRLPWAIYAGLCRPSLMNIPF